MGEKMGIYIVTEAEPETEDDKRVIIVGVFESRDRAEKFMDSLIKRDEADPSRRDIYLEVTEWEVK